MQAQKRPELALGLHLRLIPTQRHSTTIKNIANPAGRGKCDFQNYHITRFRYPVFNNNNTTQDIERKREVWPIKRKKKIDRKD